MSNSLWPHGIYSLLGSSVHGISQTRILKWVAISFSRGPSQSRVQTRVSCISRQILYHWAMREAHDGILLSHKKNEIMPFSVTWMYTILRERQISYHLYMEYKKWYKWTYFKTDTDSFFENKLMVSKGGKYGWGEINQEFGINIYTLLLLLSRFSRVRLCNTMDCSLPGSSVHGIFQARVLEWGAIAFSDTHYYI